jgi:hypothetical protein
VKPVAPLPVEERPDEEEIESVLAELPALQKAEEIRQAEKPVEAKKRGRPAKAKSVEEAPVEAPAATVTPQPLPPEISIQPTKAAPPKKEEPLSRQDLLDVFAEYVQRYGANFGYTDISNLLQQHLGDGVRKASDVPEDALPVAIGAIRTAINDNPFNRKRDYA